MKKTKIILIVFLTLININIISNNNNENIEYAIKKSNLKLLNNALENKKLSFYEKEKFTEIANKILTLRENKLLINDIKPEFHPLLGVIANLGVCCISGAFAISCIEDPLIRSNKMFSLSFIGIPTIISSIALVRAISLIKKSKNFRTRKQKYWDAILIKEIFNKKAINFNT